MLKIEDTLRTSKTPKENKECLQITRSAYQTQKKTSSARYGKWLKNQYWRGYLGSHFPRALETTRTQKQHQNLELSD